MWGNTLAALQINGRATPSATAPRTIPNGALMATSDANNTDLAGAEILWKAADA
jgi:hypothetical protein